MTNTVWNAQGWTREGKVGSDYHEKALQRLLFSEKLACDVAAQAILRCELACIYCKRNDWPKARDTLLLALSASDEGPYLRYSALHLLGVVEHQLGNTRLAVNALTEALHLGDRYTLTSTYEGTHVLSSLADALRDDGDEAGAEEAMAELMRRDQARAAELGLDPLE
jgi:lipopolysaccharide biosynthesis regulator YciM